MKLLCPKCKNELSQSEINIEKAIAHCKVCNELFKIADFIKNSEELRRIKKPIHSNITINKSYDGVTIEIPSKEWNGQSFFFLFFSVFWNSIVIFFLFSSNGESISLLFIVPFVVIGIFTALYTAFLKIGQTIINYNKEFISVTWGFIKFKYSKKQDSLGLEKITEDVIYNKNYQPVYGIGLFFKNGKKIKFGSNLNEDERKWLIGELYELKASYKK